ncbi:MAG: hypothetical protein M1500_00715 [Candidatus Marsarchaeota archaeon]|nr:hypothetical protein [Candidatus Marsarchaeota archaeon]
MNAYAYAADALIYAAGAALSFMALGAMALLTVPVFAAFALASIEYDRILLQNRQSRMAASASYMMLKIVKETMEHTGKGIAPSIRSVIKLMTKYDVHLASRLNDIREMMALGYGLQDAFRSGFVADGSRYAAISRLGEMVGRTDSMTAVRETHMNAEIDAQKGKEEAMGSLQRYASINMAVGAVVPSFVIFGFVGYSMMSNGAIAGIALVTAFGAALPFVTKVIRSKMDEMHEKV